MPGRDEIERLLREAYAARIRGDMEALGRIFSDDATFQMAGSPQASGIAVRVEGAGEVQPLLRELIKTFELNDHRILAMVIEGSKAVVHWRSKVRSTITGETVETELLDLIEVRDGRISSFLEFCDTALVTRLMTPP